MKFYALCRGEDGNVNYLQRNGAYVPNEFNLPLYVYHSDEPIGTSIRTWWHVVEGRSGVSLGHGNTRQAAIFNALNNIEHVGIEATEKSIMIAITKYGGSPIHRPTYMWGKEK